MNTTEQNNTIDQFMLGTVNRNLLKFAAGYHIFCPSCQTILDCRQTVIASANNREYVMCCACFDRLNVTFKDVVDGRQYFVSTPAKQEKKPRNKHTFKDRLEAGLKACGWERDFTDKSRYNAWKKAGESAKYFTGPSGALRRGECASRSYSIGDPTMPRQKYAYFLDAGDEQLNKPEA